MQLGIDRCRIVGFQFVNCHLLFRKDELACHTVYLARDFGAKPLTTTWPPGRGLRKNGPMEVMMVVGKGAWLRTGLGPSQGWLVGPRSAPEETGKCPSLACQSREQWSTRGCFLSTSKFR